MSRPSVSIVIVTWNTRDLTRAAVASVYACSDAKDAEVIVIDNASTDGTAESLIVEFPAARVIVNDKNHLFSEANNQGVREAKGEYVCLLNSDAKLREGALGAMVGFLATHDDYAVVGPKLLNPDGTAQDSCNRFYCFRDTVYYHTFLRYFPPGSTFLRRSRMRDFDYATSRDVQQIMAACWVIRREEFLDIGGFDPTFSLYFNDHDLCRRLLDQGKKTRFLAEAEVDHLRGETTRRFDDLSVIWQRNRLAYLRKHSGPIGHLVARQLYHVQALIMRLRVLLGPRTRKQKKEAFARLRSNVRRVMAREDGTP